MKKVKLFEQFHQDLSALYESWMSEIDLIGKDAQTKEAFKKEVKELLKGAPDPSVADNDEFIETCASTYFDKDGVKLPQPND